MTNNIKCKKTTANRELIPDIPPDTWQFIARMYAEKGMPGITYLTIAPACSAEQWIESLVYRDASGNLLGIMDYFPVDTIPHEKKGNINIFVNPEHWGKGIGLALLKEGDKRWDIDLDKQEYTCARIEVGHVISESKEKIALVDLKTSNGSFT